MAKEINERKMRQDESNKRKSWINDDVFKLMEEPRNYRNQD